ncbi:unnamed protein product, partial [Closterium sp. Naga37s-1]
MGSSSKRATWSSMTEAKEGRRRQSDGQSVPEQRSNLEQLGAAGVKGRRGAGVAEQRTECAGATEQLGAAGVKKRRGAGVAEQRTQC